MSDIFPGARAIDLIPGDPAELRVLAQRLGVHSGGLGDAAAKLGAIDATSWHGSAASSFRHVLTLQPGRYRDAAEAFSRASTGLLEFASILEWAQLDAGRAISMHVDAEAASAAWHQRQAAAQALTVAGESHSGLAEPSPRLPIGDPGDAGRAGAGSLLASARAAVDAAAEPLRSTLSDATQVAPTRPGLFGNPARGSESLSRAFAEFGKTMLATAGGGGIDLLPFPRLAPDPTFPDRELEFPGLDPRPGRNGTGLTFPVISGLPTIVHSDVQEGEDEGEAGDSETGTGGEIEIPIVPGRWPDADETIRQGEDEGNPAIGTIDREGADERRRQRLGGSDTVPGKDRDEWPPAVIKPDKPGATVRPADPPDNRGMGAHIGHRLREHPDGTRVSIYLDE